MRAQEYNACLCFNSVFKNIVFLLYQTYLPHKENVEVSCSQIKALVFGGGEAEAHGEDRQGQSKQASNHKQDSPDGESMTRKKLNIFFKLTKFFSIRIHWLENPELTPFVCSRCWSRRDGRHGTEARQNNATPAGPNPAGSNWKTQREGFRSRKIWPISP